MKYVQGPLGLTSSNKLISGLLSKPSWIPMWQEADRNFYYFTSRDQASKLFESHKQEHPLFFNYSINIL